MRYFLTITLITLFLTSACSQIDRGPNDPKELGEMIFKSFQNENYQLFLKYIFTEADCDYMVKNSGTPDSIAIAAQMKGVTNHILQTSEENFESIISTGKQNGVKWQEVKLTDVKFEIKERGKIQSADIFLFCTYKGKVFHIKLDNCHKSEAWLMMDKAEIRFEE